MRAMGLDDASIAKPMIGVVSMKGEQTPCNMTHDFQVTAAKEGIAEAGGCPREFATVSVSDGLLYLSDVGGRLHCLDAETGKCYWVHEGNNCWAIGSPLVADGKVYMPTDKCLWILAAGKERKVLNRVNLGSAMWATPVAANGTLYIASKNFLWAVSFSGKP